MSLRFAKLTRNAVRALKAGQQISEHGIVAKRLANGDVRFSINIMVDGPRIHRVIGRESEGVTREQAEQAIEVLRTRAREGRLDLPRGRKLHRSFEEAATEYLNRQNSTGGKNMKAKRHHMEKLFIPRFGSCRVDRISTTMVEDYVRERLACGLKQATINRELATLSHFYRRIGVNAELRPSFAKGSEPRKQIVVLSDADIERLMAAALVDQDDRLWLFIACAVNTAMRHSEILKVQYDHIDFGSRRIFVPLAKAGEREQPITQALADLLDEDRGARANESPFVFPNRRANSKQPYRGSMAKSFLRTVIRAGLNPSRVTPHVMRHTAITRLVRANVDIPTIQRISGHKTYAMVLRYVHIHGSHIDDAIAAIDNRFTEAITRALHTAERQING